MAYIEIDTDITYRLPFTGGKQISVFLMCLKVPTRNHLVGGYVEDVFYLDWPDEHGVVPQNHVLNELRVRGGGEI